MKLLFILAIITLLKITVLYRVYHLLPLKELKRRARAGDHGAAAIYKVAASERALDMLLYIFGIAAATVIVVGAAGYAWWTALLAIIFMAWLILWTPQPRVNGFFWRVCVATSPYAFKILSWVYPVVNLLAGVLPKPHLHSSAYELEDLVELLKAQAQQPDSRIPKQNLDIAVSALSFSDKKVAKVMTPLKKTKFVKEDEVVGPMLIDELHKTGRVSFPVVKGSAKTSSPSVVGVLFLSDIVEIGQEDKGRVRDVMKAGTYFINEECDLDQALDAVLKKQHHQLIVVNNFEEIVGVIAFEDILRQLIGERLSQEFEHYEDPHAVAGLDASHKYLHKAQEHTEENNSEDKTTLASEPE